MQNQKSYEQLQYNLSSSDTQFGQKHRLIVLSGPTAVGKGTIEKLLLSEHPNIWLSVSATTRAPRPGEIQGTSYWFMTDEDFERNEKDNKFLETATVHNSAKYGTPLQPVLDHISADIPTLLEIDLQGARRIKERAKQLNLEVLYVFIAPPNFQALRDRLQIRGTESPEQMEQRLRTARVELMAQSEFDVVIVNDDLNRATQELWQIIAQEYHRKD